MKLSSLLFTLIIIFPGILQAKSPEQVKSAFLFQIAKFIEFPQVNNNQAVTFCFYDPLWASASPSTSESASRARMRGEGE